MDDERVAGALLEEVREELLGEPFAAGSDRRVQADPREVVREILDVLDPGTTDERRRPLGEDADDVLDEPFPRLPLRDEDLDRELLDAAGEHGDRLNLRVVHLDDLAGERPQPCTPKRDILDDALQFAADEQRDRVADREPALGEHRQSGDDVQEGPLHREPGEDQDERRTGDGRQPVDPAGELADDDHRRDRKRHIGDSGADDAHDRLAPLEVRDLPGRSEVGVALPAVVPGEDASGCPRGRARHEPREREDRDDHDDPPPRGRERRVVVQQADELVEHVVHCHKVGSRRRYRQ